MKKYLLLILLSLTGYYVKSQELKNVILYSSLKQYDKAKLEIDSYMAKEKNAQLPDGWYYKAYVYNALGRSETKPIAEGEQDYQLAFDAIKKYAELDPKGKLTKEENNSTIYNTYYGFNDLGIKAYNAKDFAASFDCFKKTLEVHHYIYNNKIYGPNDLKLAAHDTDLVWNMVVLANELKNKEEGFVYKKMIADADMSDEKYVAVYDDLIVKYKKEGNAELFTKYLAAAKKYFPADKEYWDTQDIDFALKGLENEDLFAKYEELLTRLPDNYMVVFNYGFELSKYISSSDAKGKDIKGYKAKMETLFKKAISIKNTVEANLLMSNIYYDSYFSYLDEISKIKGTKPEDNKARNELKNLRNETLAKAIPYAEEAVKQLSAMEKLKATDKQNFKLVLEILTTAYKAADNTAKFEEYEKKRQEVEKL
ncbi:MAG: hypothetical protein WAU23_11300 [Ferruginibacter sp.]